MTKHILICTGLFFGLFAYAPERSPASVGCGHIVSVSCPGCVPSVPSDSSCSCAKNVTTCDCIKTSGGIQTAFITSCDIGNCDWSSADPPGFIIEPEQETECGRTLKCSRSNGAQNDCAQLNNGKCPQQSPSLCMWRQISHTDAVPYREGPACE